MYVARAGNTGNLLCRGDVDDERIRPIETVIEKWEELIIKQFLMHIFDREKDAVSVSTKIATIRDYLHREYLFFEKIADHRVYEGNHLWANVVDYFSVSSLEEPHFVSTEEALDAADHYLSNAQRHAVIIFDSMDEYEVGNRATDRAAARDRAPATP